MGILLGASWGDPASLEAAARAPARAKITWRPGSTSITMAPGETRVVTTSFVASATMAGTTMVKSARSPLSITAQGPVGAVVIGKTYPVTLTLTLDAAATGKKAGGSV